MSGRGIIFHCLLLPLSLLLALIVTTTAGTKHQHPRRLDDSSAVLEGKIAVVVSLDDRIAWWNALDSESQHKFTAIYDPYWFVTLDVETQLAYSYLANELLRFLESGADAHVDDSYTSFAPLLLRAAFHASGTYFLPDGTGGSKGGTIFHHGELEDDLNGCIQVATRQLETLFSGHDKVPLSDAVIIAGTVALQVMDFPRMDLVQVRGGRDMLGVSPGMTFRDRIPSSEDDPLELLTQHYGLTLSELTAFIGGSHNFGAAHGKCSGYNGQWTATPLSWFGPGGTDPTFFPDLLKEDWRWYEVCTFYNNTVVYKSIEDPFAKSGGLLEEEEEHSDEIPLGCPIMRSQEPLICEEQAMRGCDFADGVYGLGGPPCDDDLPQLRLKSDYFLKTNPRLRPHAEAFAADPAWLAQEFGVAFHKVMHLGLDRCGLSGHGCGKGTVCATSVAGNGQVAASKVCILDEA